MDNDTHPKTLVEAIRFFADPQVALDFMIQLRWPEGVSCPRCGCTKLRFISTRRIWECSNKHDKRRFSVKTDTIMEESPLPLDKWLIAIWMEANAKNSVSSYEIHRSLGITQKSAWFMQQRIRLAMQNGGFFRKLTGTVEADETFIGGKARNMHAGKRKVKGRGAAGKAVVMGLLERHGKEEEGSKVKAFVVGNTKRKSLQPIIREHVEAGSNVYTDALASYTGLSTDYVHGFIDHAECYVKDGVHTNGLENFWSLLKRTIKGTYVHCAPFHLFRYLDEQTFRFNERRDEDGDQGRFLNVVKTTTGRRLTWKKLTGKADDGDGTPLASSL